MQTVAVTWHAARGWSAPLPAALDSAATLVLVFGPAAMHDAQGAFDEVRHAFPCAVIAGASSGTVIGDGAVCDATLVVSVTRFEASQIRAFSAPATEETFRTGRALARSLCEDGEPVAVLAWADGLLVNGPELVRGASQALPAHVVLSGGMAADGIDYERTWVVADGQLCSGMATLVGLFGPHLRVRSACGGGSVGFGPRRRVTHAVGNVVYELDGQPALRLYEQYLGRCAAALPASASHFPLSVYRERQRDAPIIRYVLGIDRERRSLRFAGDVPRGSIVQLARAGREDLLKAADEVAGACHAEGVGSGAMLMLLVSCIGRRIVLGEQVEEEIELLAEGLSEGSSQVGFYSYGEIAGSSIVPCDLHNMTLALTTISEECTP